MFRKKKKSHLCVNRYIDINCQIWHICSEWNLKPWGLGGCFCRSGSITSSDFSSHCSFVISSWVFNVSFCLPKNGEANQFIIFPWRIHGDVPRYIYLRTFTIKHLTMSCHGSVNRPWNRPWILGPWDMGNTPIVGLDGNSQGQQLDQHALMAGQLDFTISSGFLGFAMPHLG